MSSPPSILEIQNLAVNYATPRGTIHAVRGVSLLVRENETLGIVGESGSGKSTLAFAVMGYPGANGRIAGGKILFRGRDLQSMSGQERRQLLGAQIAMVYQDPQQSLNPSIRVGEQIAEVIREHNRVSAQAVNDRTAALLRSVHMPDPGGVMQAYPHQLSGGMQQRVVIAMALACDPALLIMDEPTTGLDVTTEARILDLVNELKAKFHSATLYITHNLGVVARVCDRVAVMYAGEIVETNTVAGIFERQTHPYTMDLLRCVPRPGARYRNNPLRSIPGQVPRTADAMPAGCLYHPRCSFARSRCAQEIPPLYEISFEHRSACFYWNELSPAQLREPEQSVRMTQATAPEPAPLLKVEHADKVFDERQKRYVVAGALSGRQVRAVNDVSLELGTRETLALVGESGCGKTTLTRLIIGLVEPTRGEFSFKGGELAHDVRQRSARVRQELQIVFQNPDSSLNPRHTVFHLIARPLELFQNLSGDALRKRVAELLELVKLDAAYIDRFPSQLSGGEKQRIAIARAFASDPSLVLCDEAVSALDVSVQASILNLLVQLQQERGASFLFVSHDLGVVQYVADRVAVMYLGGIVESGTVEQVFAPPYHPYTEALLSAIPVPDPRVEQKQIRLEGSVPSPADEITGCPFHTRCPRKLGEICITTVPPMQDAGDGHMIRCHIPLSELRMVPSVVEQSSVKE